MSKEFNFNNPDDNRLEKPYNKPQSPSTLIDKKTVPSSIQSFFKSQSYKFNPIGTNNIAFDINKSFPKRILIDTSFKLTDDSIQVILFDEKLINNLLSILRLLHKNLSITLTPTSFKAYSSQLTQLMNLLSNEKLTKKAIGLLEAYRDYTSGKYSRIEFRNIIRNRLGSLLNSTLSIRALSNQILDPNSPLHYVVATTVGNDLATLADIFEYLLANDSELRRKLKDIEKNLTEVNKIVDEIIQLSEDITNTQVNDNLLEILDGDYNNLSQLYGGNDYYVSPSTRSGYVYVNREVHQRILSIRSQRIIELENRGRNDLLTLDQEINTITNDTEEEITDEDRQQIALIRNEILDLRPLLETIQRIEANQIEHGIQLVENTQTQTRIEVSTHNIEAEQKIRNKVLEEKLNEMKDKIHNMTKQLLDNQHEINRLLKERESMANDINVDQRVITDKQKSIDSLIARISHQEQVIKTLKQQIEELQQTRPTASLMIDHNRLEREIKELKNKLKAEEDLTKSLELRLGEELETRQTVQRELSRLESIRPTSVTEEFKEAVKNDTSVYNRVEETGELEKALKESERIKAERDRLMIIAQEYYRALQASEQDRFQARTLLQQYIQSDIDREYQEQIEQDQITVDPELVEVEDEQLVQEDLIFFTTKAGDLFPFGFDRNVDEMVIKRADKNKISDDKRPYFEKYRDKVIVDKYNRVGYSGKRYNPHDVGLKFSISNPSDLVNFAYYCLIAPVSIATLALFKYSSTLIGKWVNKYESSTPPDQPVSPSPVESTSSTVVSSVITTTKGIVYSILSTIFNFALWLVSTIGAWALSSGLNLFISLSVLFIAYVASVTNNKIKNII